MKKITNGFWCRLIVTVVALLVTGCVQNATYPNASLLITGDQLEELINSQTTNMVIIDARDYGNASQKVPGSINLRWKEFVNSSVNLKSVAELEKLLGAAGLSRDKKIIIYDNAMHSWGSAGRMFWMLEYLGCDDVHILNGGWDKWAEEGRPTDDMWAMELEPATFSASVQSDRLATKEHISSRLNDADFAVIDSRTFQEYNGWQLYGEPRGGHIPGAVNISYESFLNPDSTVLGYEDLKSLLEGNGITTDKEVTSNCTVGIRSGFVYFALRLMGYSRCSNYDGSIIDWGADAALSMDKMENYQSLVYPAWVAALISGDNPPTYQGNGYVIVETSWTPEYTTDPTDYSIGHIPGAIFMDTYEVENGPSREPMYDSSHDANVKSIPDMQSFLGGIGISADTTVVLYGNDIMSCGRVAWALLLAGVKDVRVLNGGYDAWIKYGGAAEGTANTRQPVAFGESAGRPDLLATMEQVKAVVEGSSADITITDDRSWDEYIGASNSYYGYFDEKGRIPQAQWIGDWTELIGSDINTVQSMGIVKKNWEAAGFSPDKKMYCYCGTGWRSGLYTYYAYLLGWPAANYDGGWYEWSTTPGNPRDTGEPQ
jgi:thiosulfate/3-mercaptopyruvate sulfurtransferase